MLLLLLMLKTSSYLVVIFKMTKEGKSLKRIYIFTLLSVYSSLLFELSNCQVIDIECGKVDIPRGLKSEGNQTSKGLWPFAAVLYKKKESTFFCGGTLISTKHVLTAAHCIQDKNFEMKYFADDVSVVLGAYGLMTLLDPGVKHVNVSQIFIHSDWKEFDLTRYDADIAILLLNESVIFTHYIRPVCIPTDDDIIEGDKGFIVGWNLTEEISKHSAVNALNDSQCYNSFVSFLSSARTLCGSGEGESPLIDVSGGGFFIISGTAWVQYGITIISTTDESGTNTSVVLTNVKSFKNWIVDTVRQSGGSVSEATKMKINLDCEYVYIYSSYACVAHSMEVTSKNIGVGAFFGSHASGQNDQKVELLQLHNGTLFYLPNGFGNIFNNLKIVFVGYPDQPSLNLRLIRRSNFQNMANLVEIAIHKNDIETLDEDVLWDLPNLQRFQLDGKLKIIKERTFEKNAELREVYLASNQLEFLPRYLFKNNLLLDWVNFSENSLKIIEIDFLAFKNIKYIFLFNNACINTHYNGTANSKEDSNKMVKLKEFQFSIMHNCSSNSS